MRREVKAHWKAVPCGEEWEYQSVTFALKAKPDGLKVPLGGARHASTWGTGETRKRCAMIIPALLT